MFGIDYTTLKFLLLLALVILVIFAPAKKGLHSRRSGRSWGQGGGGDGGGFDAGGD